MLAFEGSSTLHSLGLEGLCYDHVLQLFTTRDFDGGVGGDYVRRKRPIWKVLIKCNAKLNSNSIVNSK